MNFLKISKFRKPKSLFFLPIRTKTSEINTSLEKLNNLDSSSKSKALHIKIPKTTFNPRFHAKSSETLYHPKISQELYQWQQNRDYDSNLIEFNLHEAPISLHEDLHLGHFYNKTIKDFILRMKVMKGMKVNSMLGFNCHGNSIENAALRKYTHENERYALTVQEIRELCQKYINESFEEYIKKIKRWGIMTDVSKVYLTSSLP